MHRHSPSNSRHAKFSEIRDLEYFKKLLNLKEDINFK